MQCEVSSKSVNLYHPTLCWIFYFCLFCWDSTSPFVHSHISVWPYFSPTLEWAPDTPITWAEEWSRRAKARLIFNTNTDSESIVFPSPNFTHSSKAYTAPFCLTCLSLCHSVPTTCLLYDTSEHCRDAWVLAGQTSSETGSSTVAFVQHCILVQSCFSVQLLALHSISVPSLVTQCLSLMLAWDTKQCECCTHVHKPGTLLLMRFWLSKNAQREV